MIVEHHQAVLDLLGGLTMTLYDGQVPNEPAFPYAVVYMDTDNEGSTRLCGNPDRAVFRFQVTSVGLSRKSAAIVADAARSLVLNVRPVVTGRTCERIKKDQSIPVRPDRDVTIPPNNLHPMFAVDTYHFVSHAA